MLKFYQHLLTRRIIFGTTVGAAIFFMVIGVVYWGAFNTAMEMTNELEFCISCHEMKNNVYQDYTHSIHYKNRSGVRAICSDCHVPDEWKHKVVRKIRASNELFHKLTGSINTTEKFNAKRLELATIVWQGLTETDSRECRNCHDFDAMNIGKQKSRSGLVHKFARKNNKTCIDCHKGIAHRLPDGFIAYRGGSDEDHSQYKAANVDCYLCHTDMPKPVTEDWGY